MQSWKVPRAQSSAPRETLLNQTIHLTYIPRSGFVSLTHCPQTPLSQAGCDVGWAWFLCLQRFWGSWPRIYFLKGGHEVLKMCLNCWDKYIPKSLIRVLSALWVAAAAAKSLQSCPTPCDPIDGSPPGSPVPGILQARTLEWVAISFSNAWKWSCSVVSNPQRPHGLQPTRLLHPWDSPGKSTGVGCHCLLRCEWLPILKPARGNSTTRHSAVGFHIWSKSCSAPWRYPFFLMSSSAFSWALVNVQKIPGSRTSAAVYC